MVNENIKNNKNGLARQNVRSTFGGFTLIELMVATSIFVIIMLSSMSSLFILLGASKGSRALRFAMDNVSFAMESMTRSIRMGTNYYCVSASSSIDLNITTSTRDCTSAQDGTFLAFVPYEFPTFKIGYKLHTNADNTRTLQRCDLSGCVSVVSPEVNIESLRFIVKGSDVSDDIQASVYIIMKGTVTVKDVPTSFSIQTMASQRNF